ncbi:MAG: biotin--[acetyl-CoA-carboxylase] ligase [Planctomycetaceae bacterium]|nr:biotin--[acetyl-CoA-carboxylase] ligase [Planctomycetaceae bacterium]
MCNIGLCELSPICFYEYYESISSTNDRVRELFNEFFVGFDCGGARDGGGGDGGVFCNDRFPCLIVAGEQVLGRGRGGKRWWSDVGGLMFSLGVELGSDYFPVCREVLPEFSPVVGGVILDILRRYILPKDVIELKAPNDVYVNKKKIAGILIESPAPNFAIIGIGINVNNSAKNAPEELKQNITSIYDLTGKITDLRTILLELVKAIFDKGLYVSA